MSVVYVLAKPPVNLDLSVLRNLSTYKTYEEEPNIQQMRKFLRKQLIRYEILYSATSKVLEVMLELHLSGTLLHSTLASMQSYLWIQ